MRDEMATEMCNYFDATNLNWIILLCSLLTKLIGQKDLYAT